ncbi:SsrA-binding protein SmpB [Gleimia hominis]|uniref:SsrA-binding protein n=1 Tax=Gleimia hominis TaxID=595468 RepID=A0ABU3IAC5_9ACTO|nr:SsrA-binding protein SmpB [Gleimia hominis]MDT3767323.1 SsrA-binding protein SmpB [Gleimia hominis]WIK65375.1 SsrA-binding protein SmpB [Gleimia hominis]
MPKEWKKQTAAQKAKEASDAKKVIARNRRATHDYFIEDRLEAGLSLTGTEVKALRMGRASLAEAWVEIYDGEVWLHQANIPEYLAGTWTNHAPTRKRKLLLHKEEIAKWGQRSAAKGYTIVPLELYFVRGIAKVQIGLAKGKQEWDKRQALREAQDKREAQREIQRFAKGHR